MQTITLLKTKTVMVVPNNEAHALIESGLAELFRNPSNTMAKQRPSGIGKANYGNPRKQRVDHSR